MKRATVTFPNEIEQALEAYLKDQEVPLALTAVVQTALRDYLAERGYLPSAYPLKITPAKQGSGQRDISLAHDRYLAER
jgi:hypothetical protein